MVPPQTLPRARRITPGRRESLHQVVNFQRMMFAAGQVIADDVKSDEGGEEQRARAATALANLGKSWCTLQDAKREIKGVPRVKPVEARARGTRRPAPHSPPVFDPQDEPAPSPLPTAHSADKSAAA